jgi:hypothetical protein
MSICNQGDEPECKTCKYTPCFGGCLAIKKELAAEKAKVERLIRLIHDRYLDGCNCKVCQNVLRELAEIDKENER